MTADVKIKVTGDTRSAESSFVSLKDKFNSLKASADSAASSTRSMASATDSLAANAREAASSMESLKSASSGLSGGLGALKTMAGPLAALFAADKIKDFAVATFNASVETGRMAQQLGVTVETVAGFNFVAKQGGLETEAFTNVLSKLGKKAYEAAQGNADAKASFDALGISVKDAQGNMVPTDKLLLALSEKFKDMPDGVGKTSIAMKLLEEEGKALIPVLNQGSASLQTQIEKGANLSSVTADSAKAAREFAASMESAKAFAQGMATALMNQLGPAFSWAAEKLQTLTDDWARFKKDLKEEDEQERTIDIQDTQAKIVALEQQTQRSRAKLKEAQASGDKWRIQNAEINLNKAQRDLDEANKHLTDLLGQVAKAKEDSTVGPTTAPTTTTTTTKTPTVGKARTLDWATRGMSPEELAAYRNRENAEKAFSARMDREAARQDEAAKVRAAEEAEKTRLHQEELARIDAENKARQQASDAELALAKRNADINAQMLKDEKEASDRKVKFAQERSEKIMVAEANLAGAVSQLLQQGDMRDRQRRLAWKAAAATQASINSYLAFTQAIGQEGPAGVISGAAVLIAGLAQAENIRRAKFARGGLVSGPSSGDRVAINANGGELVLTKEMQMNLLGMLSGDKKASGGTVVYSPTYSYAVDSGTKEKDYRSFVRYLNRGEADTQRGMGQHAMAW